MIDNKTKEVFGKIFCKEFQVTSREFSNKIIVQKFVDESKFLEGISGIPEGTQIDLVSRTVRIRQNKKITLLAWDSQEIFEFETTESTEYPREFLKSEFPDLWEQYEQISNISISSEKCLRELFESLPIEDRIPVCEPDALPLEPINIPEIFEPSEDISEFVNLISEFNLLVPQIESCVKNRIQGTSKLIALKEFQLLYESFVKPFISLRKFYFDSLLKKQETRDAQIEELTNQKNLLNSKLETVNLLPSERTIIISQISELETQIEKLVLEDTTFIQKSENIIRNLNLDIQNLKFDFFRKFGRSQFLQDSVMMSSISNLTGFRTPDFDFTLEASEEVQNILSEFLSEFSEKQLYVVPLKKNSTEERRGILEDFIWKKVYNSRVIELLFSPGEIGFTYSTDTEKVPKVSENVTLKFFTRIDKNLLVRIDEKILKVKQTDEWQKFQDKISESCQTIAEFFVFLAKKKLLPAKVLEEIQTDFVWSSRLSEYLSNSIRAAEAQYESSVKCIDSSLNTIISSNSESAEKECSECLEKLGSSVNKMSVKSDLCPNPLENCYWKEYTKKLQTISVLPVPDIQSLSLRFFRYYPIGFVFTSPSPVPTLASGIPDSRISIPCPLVWKHIRTISTSFGLFVIYVGISGIVPNIFVFFIDEQGKWYSLVNNRLRPTEIPEKIGIPTVEPTVLETTLRNFRIPISVSSSRFSELDTPKEFAFKFLGKLKTGITNLQLPDLSTQISKLLKITEIPSFESEWRNLQKILWESIESSMKFGDIKIPKNSKYLSKVTRVSETWQETFSEIYSSNFANGSINVPETGFTSKVSDFYGFAKRNLTDPKITRLLYKYDTKFLELENSLGITNLQRELLVREFSFEFIENLISLVLSKLIEIQILKDGCCKKLEPVNLGILKPIVETLKAQMSSMVLPKILSSFRKGTRLPRSTEIMNLIIIPSLQGLPIQLPNVKNLLAAIPVLNNLLLPLTFKLRPPKLGVTQVTIGDSVFKNFLLNLLSGAFAVFESELKTSIGNPNLYKSLIQQIFGNGTPNDLKSLTLSLFTFINTQDIEKLFPFTNLIESQYKTIISSLVPLDSIDLPRISYGLTDRPINLYQKVQDLLSKVPVLPFPLVCLSCSSDISRKLLVSTHPYKSKESLPLWSEMSLSNVPYVIWLDSLVASCQKLCTFGDSYVAPYGLG